MLDHMLSRLNGANRTAVFLVTALIVVATLLVGGWPAAIALSAVAAAVTALLIAGWRFATPRQRIMRIGVLALLVLLVLVVIRR